MSATGHVVVLPVVDGRAAPRPAPRFAARAARPLVHVLSFAALGLYGVMRWTTLLAPRESGRLLGMLGVAVVLGVGGALLARRSRLLALLLALVAAVAMFPLAGIPLSWVAHARLAVVVNGIGEGLSALPRVLVPYSGINEWVRVVIMLGAAVLLLDAGLLLAFASPALGDVRRAGAALPLIALAVVPSTLVHPQYSYVQGVILFALLALFLWGERIARDDVALALAVCAVAAVGGMIAAPLLDRHKPWINYEALAGTFAPTHVDSFDWSQQYGPLNWPRTGHVVMEVKAARATYWKAEDLDVFDGKRWSVGNVSAAPALESVDASARKRWTQTEQVTLRAMRTSNVIASGTAEKPTHVAPALIPGTSPGTWTVNGELGPGDSYAVRVYSPSPTARQLRTAGTDYPASLAGYLKVTVPAIQISRGRTPVFVSAQDIQFDPFGATGAPTANPLLGKVPNVMSRSAYASAFALVQRLKRPARTPYAFVASVEAFLSRGFTYDESPPLRPYPLESFLFKDKLGYCQQFAGAMALLLRMGGVPARVAAGFTSGSLDSTTHRWLVTDFDAHAWVEAWFPHYGWVPFDPTPAADPARGGHAPIDSIIGLNATNPKLKPGLSHRDIASSPTSAPSVGHRRASTSWLVVVLVLVLAGALALVIWMRLRPRPAGDEDPLVAELERALRRTGRSVGPGVTLAVLERRFRESHDAAAYIRAVRLARFAGSGVAPTPAQRNAFRAELRAGLGWIGRIRALWALPPRPPRPSPNSR